MAAARETLSPLINHPQTRRLSLEFCQKLGINLLSSSSSTTLVKSSSDHLNVEKNDLKTPSPSSKSFSHQNCSPYSKLGNSPLFNKTLTSQKSPFPNNYNYNRRGSDSFRWNCSPFSNQNEKPADQPTRRSSLTLKQLADVQIVASNNSPLSSVVGAPILSYNAANQRRNSIPIPLIRFSDVRDDAENEDLSQLCNSWKEQQKLRRKSSSSRYDFDANFKSFVFQQCNLDLDPELVLGRGSFGTVISGTYKGNSVAVKLINLKSSKHLESMKGEENALNMASHPNVAAVIDIFQPGPNKALIIMERLRKGSLLKVLNDPKVSIGIPLKLRICKEIGSALVFCHVQGILHLDVKPQNVLIDLKDRCKLSDFGNSRKVSELSNCSDFTKLDGTVPYKAPELFQGICPTTKCDVYSFGISMWQILTRETPYKSEPEHSIIYKVVSQGLRPVCKYNRGTPHNLLQSYIKIYEECWCQEPTFRPDMKVVLQNLRHLQLTNLNCIAP